MTLQEAQRRLLAYVQDRIHNGEFTERGLARLMGISQPHVHNVLKGVRKLSPGVFDATLKYFHLSILDLAASQELEANLIARRPVFEVPFLHARIGPGFPWQSGINPRRSYSLPYLEAPASLVMAELVPDLSMYQTLAQHQLALLDISERQRSNVSPEGLFVISRSGEARLRYIRPGARCYYLLTDLDRNTPELWERLASNDPREFVKARVLSLR